MVENIQEGLANNILVLWKYSLTNPSDPFSVHFFHSTFLDLVIARALQLHCLHRQSPFGNVDLFYKHLPQSIKCFTTGLLVKHEITEKNMAKCAVEERQSLHCHTTDVYDHFRVLFMSLSITLDIQFKHGRHAPKLSS